MPINANPVKQQLINVKHAEGIGKELIACVPRDTSMINSMILVNSALALNALMKLIVQFVRIIYKHLIVHVIDG